MGGFCCCFSPLPPVILSDTSVIFEKISDPARQISPRESHKLNLPPLPAAAHLYGHINMDKQSLAICLLDVFERTSLCECNSLCVCRPACWQPLFRSGSRSEEMFGFCLVSAAAGGVDYLWVSR